MEIKIFLIHSSRIIRDAISELIVSEESLSIVGVSESITSCEVLSIETCDIVLIEQQGDFTTFLKSVKHFMQRFKARLIIFSDNEANVPVLQNMLEAGVAGYLTMNANREELFHAVKKVMDDGLYISTGFCIQMLKKEGTGSRANKFVSQEEFTLSVPEQQVLNLLSDGLTNREIANKLYTSVRTIESRRKALLEKTGTINTATLIRRAIHMGLIV